jgi:arginase
MTLDLIAVPYDAGHRSTRMGRGPEALLEAGLERHLEALGHSTTLQWVEASSGRLGENGVAFDLAASLSARVAEARERGAFPLVLAGNCASVWGAVAGIGEPRPAVVWLDAHGDFNTPETSRSGFLDGMSASVLTGGCWVAAAAAIPGFSPVPESALWLVGTRDLDPDEAAGLEASDVTVVPPAALRGPDGVEGALASLAASDDPVHLHLDLDVLDPDAVGRANRFAAPGGLELRDVQALVEWLARRRPIGACTISAYDPEVDAGGRVRAAAFALIGHLADVVRRRDHGASHPDGGGVPSEPSAEPSAQPPWS